MTELERFFKKVNKTNTCWLWTAGVSTRGYGVFHNTLITSNYAHRYSYSAFVGQIPEGMVVDHLCGVKLCVNPRHLEPVTNKENLRRGEVGQQNAKHHKSKTHCKNGHEYTDENTEFWNRKSRGVLTRRCKICYNKQQERYKDKKEGGHHSKLV